MSKHFSVLPTLTPKCLTIAIKSALAVAGVLSLAAINAEAQTGNPRVNQLGYLPSSAKIASYKGSGGPVQWQLKQNGALVASGMSTGSTFDPASGDDLKQIDMSSVSATGTGFTLSVGGDTSYPFSIKQNVYDAALYDSLRYFYHNRAGIEIKTQYTGGGRGSYAANSKWARPAGHLNAGSNRGDFNVGCWTGMECNYALSPIKGWYDAGDHGKYVVNGGISAWTLLNMYERNRFIAPNSTNLADGTFNIPESGNGIADILDEARWEVEFMLAMQVPAGQPKAGMVHHKLQDVGWTGIPTRPDRDHHERKVVQLTTAATLNLAAVAAQCARIWKDIDAGFASQCLSAATRAWDAAKANPNDLYKDTLFGDKEKNQDNGGGGYGDNRMADDFYWAAAELYITTGDSKYVTTLNSFALDRNDFGWADTELAGVISLATVPNSRSAAAKQKLISAANIHVATQNASGYSATLEGTKDGYDWGSNSFVMNRLIIIGLAYDFTDDSKYSNAVSKGLDYLFGRNVFSTSFVTGLGTKTMIAPHHRFWANTKDASYPTPPPGAISGGPNARNFVGTAEGAPGGCESKPATCWKDDIGAFATNEITINWNSPLAWVLNWQKDFADGAIINPGSSSSSSSSLTSSVATSSSSSSSVVTTSTSSSSSSSSSDVIFNGITVQAESFAQMSGVQTEAVTDEGGGLNVGWIDAGDWMTYSVNIPVSGSYRVSYRVASANGGGLLQLEKAGGSPVYGSLDVPKTGAWQNWQTISHVVNLPAGQQSIGLAAKAGGWNLNWIKIESLNGASSSSSSSKGTTSSSSSSSSSSSASSVAPSNKCTFTVTNDWGSGYTGVVRFTNKGSSVVNGWTIGWAFTDGTRVTESWNAVVSGANPYTAKNISWNGTVQPGQTVEFGFNATKGGSAWNTPVFSGACN